MQALAALAQETQMPLEDAVDAVLASEGPVTHAPPCWPDLEPRSNLREQPEAASTASEQKRSVPAHGGSGPTPAGRPGASQVHRDRGPHIPQHGGDDSLTMQWPGGGSQGPEQDGAVTLLILACIQKFHQLLRVTTRLPGLPPAEEGSAARRQHRSARRRLAQNALSARQEAVAARINQLIAAEIAKMASIFSRTNGGL